MKKYYFYTIIFFVFLLFCSVGYAILSKELTISGSASVDINTKIQCNISKINNNNLTVSINNEFFSSTAGEIQITITNNTNNNYNYFTILVDLPENITISNAYNGTYTITENLMQIHGPDYSHNININDSFTYHIQWTTNDTFTGLLAEEVAAFGNDSISTYTCTNGKWYLNGNLITSEIKQDLHLTSLSVNNYTLLPTFNSKVYTYSLTVPNNINSITISATPVDTNTIITGTGEKTIQEGNNEINIIITGTNNDSLTYKINVHRTINGVGPNQNFVNGNLSASYSIDYQSENTYQFTLTITNNSSDDISNWELSFDIGTGGIDSIWNSIYSSYDTNSGLLTFSTTTSTDESLRVIKPNTSVQIRGQIQAEYEPKIVKLSY